MAKALKRIFMLFMLLIFSVAGYIIALTYSDELATDVAHLECALVKADGEYHGNVMDFDLAMRIWGPVGYARLRNNWIQQRIVLHWVDDQNMSEDGLEGPIYLVESTLAYSGYDYLSQRFRRFDRETLIYRSESQENSSAEASWYFERQCKTISKNLFEEKRMMHVDQTLSRQKI
jgi:hypothetical protein